MALVNLNDVSIGFGGPLLLNKVSLQIRAGERVCLLGRNGTGKTTLMRLISRDLEPDNGTIAFQQGVTTALLPQEVPGEISGTVSDVVLGGLAKEHELTTMETEEKWEILRQVETIITRMKLAPEASFETLSAGLKRRVLLAKALAGQPGILLLDEPTNHLDIDAITWLEEFLSRLKRTLLFVTHDRMLVRKLAARIIEIDRGNLYSWDCNYDTYLERKEAALEAEQGQWAVFDKKLAKEEEWIRQGIKARRTRDEGRVAALLKMREERRSRREQMGTVKMQLQEGRLSGKLVIEAENVSFSYENKDKPVVRDFTALIIRGDRVGIIGPNGCGKTTLLRLLLGELTALKGKLRLGTNLQISYFDQLRGQLDEEKSVQDNVAEGSDRIKFNGKTRHIIGYLQDFLFSPERARSPVKVLSGGERNRLLLAKLFAKPSNLLVMDEPTNDLDIETLELLEELLLNYPGTLLLVSHDRAFLNNVVTSTLVFEGEGNVTEYIGGYDDWLMQRPAENSADPPAKKIEEKGKNKNNRGQDASARPRKLTNKEKQELETLPHKIEQLEAEQEQLYKQMAEPKFYQQEGQEIAASKDRLETLKQGLTDAYQRWEDLVELQTAYTDFKG